MLRICLYVLAAILVAQGVQGQKQSRCDSLVLLPNATTFIGSPVDLLACFGEVPFNLSIANETIAQLLNLVDMYAFTDLAVNSSANGAAYDMKVDLISSLKNISESAVQGVYKRDVSFHRAVSSLFLQLRDAHTRYELPKGYSSFIVKPFSLKVTRHNGEMKFYLADPGRLSTNGTRIVDIFQTYKNFTLTKYLGQEVTHIDDKPVLTYLLKFADNFVGLYKDQQVRVNALLRRGGFWQVINVLRYGMEFHPYCTMRLSSKNVTQNVTVPYLAVYGFKGPVNVSIIQQRNMPSSNSSSALKRISGAQTVRDALTLRNANRPLDPHQEIENDLDHLDDLLGARLPQEEVEGKKRMIEQNTSKSLQIIKRSDNDTFVYMIVDDTYAVFKLTTFAPVPPGDDNLTSPQFNNFLKVVKESFEDFRQRKFTQVMIDMSRNGGGLICLAYDLLASLVFEWSNYTKDYESVVWQPYDARRSPIMDAQIEQPAGMESYAANYGNMNSREYWKDASWFNEAETYVRGGRKSLYLKKSYFPFSCGNPKIALLDPPGWPKNKLPYLSDSLDKIIVITDGTCGSACSLFLTKLQTFKKALTVSYGGVLSRTETEPMDTSSFAGGNVLDWDEVIRELQTLNMTGELTNVQSLPTTAYARFNHHETYTTPDATLPREFIRIPADKRLYDWGPIWESSPVVDGQINKDLLKLYQTAAHFFKEMDGGAPGVHKPWKEAPPAFFSSKNLWLYVVIGCIGVMVVTVIILVIMQVRRNAKHAEEEVAHAHVVGYERVPTEAY